MLLTALTRTLAQSAEPRFRAVVIKSVLLTLALFAVLTAAFLFFRPEIRVIESDWFYWINDALEVGSTLLFFAVLILLFATLASFVSTLFLDEIADAVEGRYYPSAVPARKVPVAEGLAVSLRFTVITVLLNILVLPLYLFGIFFPPFFAFIFYVLNGYLLSREYFELVSLRHMDATQSRGVRRSGRRSVFPAGVLIAFATTIPILNLFVPILATAFMLHVYHGLQQRGAAVQ